MNAIGGITGYRGCWRRMLLVALAAGLFPVLALAQNTVQWKTNYYTVTGSNLREIRHSMDRSRPRKDGQAFDGLTAWQIQWQMNLMSNRGECRCASFTTRTSITMTLPRWAAPTNAPATVRSAWQRYIRALEQHEVGHGQFALAAAAEMHKRIKDAGTDPSCEDLRNTVNGMARAVMEEFRQKEREYDQRTEHGVKQGVVLRFETR
jgi:predicted secreted Zn-dependent protease